MRDFIERTNQRSEAKSPGPILSNRPVSTRNPLPAHVVAPGLHHDFGRISIHPGVVQRKAEIGAVNDPLEREADRMAETAVGAATPQLTHPTQPVEGLDAESAVRAAERPGATLPPELASGLGRRFGHDFSRVRVHADGEAAAAARSIHARAYAVGNDIVFAAGQYAPGTLEGKRLIAHELSHVVQQTFGRVPPAGGSPATATVRRSPDGPESCTASAPVLVYLEGSENTACITESEFQRNYIDNYIVRATGLATPGTTWGNIDDSRVPRMKLTYKDGRTKILNVSDIPLVTTETLPRLKERQVRAHQPVVYERRSDGFIYPVFGEQTSRRDTNFSVTSNLLSLRAGLHDEIHELQQLFTLVEVTAFFASQVAALGGIAATVQHGTRSGGLFEPVERRPQKGGTGEADEPPVRIQLEEGDESAHGGKPPQKQLSSKELKGTGKITSDPDPRTAKLARKGRDVTELSVYEMKKASKDPDVQSEVRMGERFAEEGHDVRFNANDRNGDLTVDGVGTDVKHLHKVAGMVSAISRGRSQGSAVIIDGTTVKLTQTDADAGIHAFEQEAAQRPQKFAGIKTIYVVKGDGGISIYHRDTTLKVEKVGAGGTGLPR